MVYVDKVDTLFIKNASQGLCPEKRQQLRNNFVLTDAWQVQDKGPDPATSAPSPLELELQLQLQLHRLLTPHKGQQRK